MFYNNPRHAGMIIALFAGLSASMFRGMPQFTRSHQHYTQIKDRKMFKKTQRKMRKAA